jgi:hypothetical protein
MKIVHAFVPVLERGCVMGWRIAANYQSPLLMLFNAYSTGRLVEDLAVGQCLL